MQVGFRSGVFGAGPSLQQYALRGHLQGGIIGVLVQVGFAEPLIPFGFTGIRAFGLQLGFAVHIPTLVSSAAC